jgi:putative N-acetylmannosamine-6-phosphate epimerase/predicted NBD/HSP70 family sugar kinase
LPQGAKEAIQKMCTIQEQLRGKLVVSCQAFPGDPLDDADTIRRMARAVVGAGAEALRLNSAEHIRLVRQDTNVPIIGIQKRYENGVLRITPDFAAASALAEAGTTIIALDCTCRSFSFGEPWQQLIQKIHNQLKLPVMADVATFAEARAAAEAGADFVGTTLNGYTEETRNNHAFSWTLLAKLVSELHVPIVAEGHLGTPDEVKRALAVGACCAVVGSAITRPGEITATFLRALHPAKQAAQVIGVDLGGTSIKAGLVDHNGAVTLTAQVPTEAAKGREVIAANLATAIEQVLAQARQAGIAPCAISVHDGSVFAATDNLPGWAGFDLRGFAEERFHLPTRVLNDAHAAVLAELHYGLGRGLTDFVAVTVGTGIGGGVVSNGRLLQGNHGFAGSIGHHVLRADGLPCNCGRRGCLEAYVSTAALLREYRERAGAAAQNSGMADDALAFEIGRLARAGDSAAVGAYAVLTKYLAEGVANLFNLFDPQVVLISGGLVQGYPALLPELEKQVTGLLHFGVKRAPRIQLAAGGYYAGVQGAGALALSSL